MSSSSPNIQQIPNPDRSEHANLIRKIYIPEPGKRWVSADWSNQEGRWQVHFGQTCGSQSLIDAFNKDPNLDLHSDIAEILFEYKKDSVALQEHKARRKITKGINLGISYGMGNAKLSEVLGKTLTETMALRELYNTKLPFLFNLGRLIEGKLKQKQFINFFDGRVFRRESAWIGSARVYFDYKGINALMQGSGASQMYRALYECYMQGLDILFPVHDEINIQVSGIDAESDTKLLRIIMEDLKNIKCRVPMPVNVQSGSSWGELK
jgi:DNA polymerase-1